MPRSTKKRVYKRKRSSVATKAFVKRQLQKTQELKSWDSSGNHNIDDTFEIALSNSLIGQGIVEGTGGDERIGRKVVITDFHIKMRYLHNPGAAADSYGNTFTAIVLDKEFNGTAPTAAQVFDTPGTLGGAQVFRNRDYLSRFKVLKTWTHTWGAKAGVSTALLGSCKFEDFKMKCNLPIEYVDNTGALASMRGNAIFMFSGSSGVGIDDTVNCQHVRREHWTDGGSNSTSTKAGTGMSWGQSITNIGMVGAAAYASLSLMVD
uniref:hypothetical protein n=1 Tax=Yoonia sp. TaxID=2212373 RepID=UPI0040470DC0